MKSVTDLICSSFHRHRHHRRRRTGPKQKRMRQFYQFSEIIV